jgi:hypothetical protein
MMVSMVSVGGKQEQHAAVQCSTEGGAECSTKQRRCVR